MAKAICQFVWATVPRYLIEHYSEYFSESGFWMRLTFKSVDFGESTLLSTWVGLIQSLEGLSRTKTDLP